MYKAHYINPLAQFGSLELTLLIEDDEGVMPNHRLRVVFSENVTEEELKQVAETKINLILQEQELPEQVAVSLLEVDLPPGFELGDN